MLLGRVMDRADVRLLFLRRAREVIGHDVCLSLDVSDVGCIFRNTGKLVRLSCCLRVRLLGHGWNQTLVVGVKRKRAALDERSEVSDGFE